ncbi:hypothetical protein TruAng_009373 [Truncatella angustata]|nr:hypothetical protein TruAng_009373 [Truncatella angustata]
MTGELLRNAYSQALFDATESTSALHDDLLNEFLEFFGKHSNSISNISNLKAGFDLTIRNAEELASILVYAPSHIELEHVHPKDFPLEYFRDLDEKMDKGQRKDLEKYDKDSLRKEYYGHKLDVWGIRCDYYGFGFDKTMMEDIHGSKNGTVELVVSPMILGYKEKMGEWMEAKVFYPKTTGASKNSRP